MQPLSRGPSPCSSSAFFSTSFGLGIFCWARFALAIHVLRFFVGNECGDLYLPNRCGSVRRHRRWLYGRLALVVGQWVFSIARPSIVRFVIGLLFAIPAARAGYDVTLALSHIGIPSEWWRELFAMLGAIAVGSSAWARVSMQMDPALRPGAPHCSAAEWGDDHRLVSAFVVSCLVYR